MSSEFSFFATEGHREHREKKEIRLSGDQVGGNQELRRSGVERWTMDEGRGTKQRQIRNPKHDPSASLRTRIRNLRQIRITKTENPKQTITSYFDGGYGSRIPISSKKNKKLKDCITNDRFGLPSRVGADAGL
jgi:hypothetical protein